MFAIRYNNCFSSRRVEFYEPFQRLNYCNAAYYQIMYVSNSEYNSNGHTHVITKHALVSYETPICRVVNILDTVTRKDVFIVYVNRDSYNCSNSTIHQLVRFLRIAMGDLFTYQEIKQYAGYRENDILINSYAPINLRFVDECQLLEGIAYDNNGDYCFYAHSA